MARPRSITNEAILAAAFEILIEQGPNSVTFEQLSERVGLVPAALVRRFGNKKQLFLEIDKYALRRTNAKVQEAVAQAASSVEAIITQFSTELWFATTVARFANGQEFLLMDLRDKTLYDNYRSSFEHRHQQIIELLEKAQADGELEDIADIHELTRHLEMLIHGAGHVWAMTNETSIDDYISHHVKLALKPYMLTEE
jgi:AcrR family transcriptional regulator